MQPDDPFAESLGSFRQAIPVPVNEPNAGTLMHVCFNREWLPSILGALLQLLEQATWRTDDPDALHLAQLRSCLLIDMFMSEWCEMTVGMIAFFAGTSPPDGWLICNGAPVDRACYAALFATIGVVFGPGDGSTTFNLPDLAGRLPVGVGQQSGGTDFALGGSGGEETHTLTTTEMPEHNHADAGHAHSYGGTFAVIALTGEEPVAEINPIPASTGTGYANISNTGGGEAHNNLPPYLAILPIIKF